MKHLKKVIEKLITEESKGLWHNINQKKEKGEKPARKGSEAYKSAVKAAKEINKATNEEAAKFTDKHDDSPKLKGDQKKLPDQLQAQIVKKENHEGGDHEVSMANNSLRSIVSNASQLIDKVGQDEKDIPAWIQDHIAKAENYIEQANSNYHEYGEEDHEELPTGNIKLMSALQEMYDEDDVEETRFQIGDIVLVTYPNQYKGEQGEIVELSRDGSFLTLEMPDGNTVSMHSSDVELADDSDFDDNFGYDDEGWDDGIRASDDKHPGGFPGMTEARDINDPARMASAARIHAFKQRQTQPKQSLAQFMGQRDNDFEIEQEIKALKRDRLQLMRDMEQEAEPEGGPIADDYGDRLNQIDQQIADLQAQLIGKSLEEDTIQEANVPSNILEFAKRKGVSALVQKVARWAEKAGKRIVGGTAIGKNYNALVLDLTYNGGEIYIDCFKKQVKVNDQYADDYESFVYALDPSNFDSDDDYEYNDGITADPDPHPAGFPGMTEKTEIIKKIVQKESKMIQERHIAKNLVTMILKEAEEVKKADNKKPVDNKKSSKGLNADPEVVKKAAKNMPKPDSTIAVKGLKDLAKKAGLGDADVKVNPGNKEVPVELNVKGGKQDLKEEGITLTLVLLAPTILEYLGKLVNWFTKDIKDVLRSGYEKDDLQKMKDELLTAQEKYKAADKVDDRKGEEKYQKEVEHLKHEIDKIEGNVVGNFLQWLGHLTHSVYLWLSVKPLVEGFGLIVRKRYGWDKAQGKYKEQPKFETIARLGSSKQFRQYISELIYCVFWVFVAGSHMWKSLTNPEVATKMAKAVGTTTEVVGEALNAAKGSSSLKGAIEAALKAV